MNRFNSLTLLLLLPAGTALAAAQSTADDGQHRHHAPTEHATHQHGAHGQPQPAVDAAFKKYDTNKDGMLTKNELAGHRLSAHFAMLDKNKDGRLSPAEFEAGKGM